MPDGLHHARIQFSGWAVILPTSIFASFMLHPVVGFGIEFGYLLGTVVNPDSDQLAISYGDGIAIRKLWVFGWILVAYLTLYAAIFRKLHRSFWTHFPFVSTAIRWIYLFWWLWFLPIVWHDWQLVFLFCTYLGLSLSDLGHWISDTWFSRGSNE